MTQIERECLRSLSDAAINFIYDSRKHLSYWRATQHPLYPVALHLNNLALGSRLGAA